MVKPITAALAACVALGLSASPSAARDGWSPGAAAAVGVVGGLAAGAAIAGAASGPGYYPGRPVRVAPPPPEYLPPPPPYAYGPPPPRRVYYERYDEPRCFVRERRYVDRYGDDVVRRTRICD